MRAGRWWAAGIAAALALTLGAWVAWHRSLEATTELTPAAPPNPAATLSLPTEPAARPAAASTPAVAAATVVPPPTRRFDYESARDLYALANAAVNSSAPVTLHNGHRATIACIGAPQRQQLEALASGGPADADGRERQRAASLVLQRCAGFFDNDYAANNELRRRLRERLIALGEYVPGTNGGPSDRQLALALDRGDLETLAFADLVPRMLAHAGLPVDGAERLTFGVAMLLAQCDLGQDCSPGGLGYARACTYHLETCAGSWDAFNRRHMNDMTKVQQREFRQRADEIVAAFRRKDLAYFGIGGAPAKP